MKKRLALNLMAALIILAVAILASSFYAKPAPLQRADLDLPELTALRYVDASVKESAIGLAVVLPEKGQGAYIVQDILTMYKWARSQFRPPKCGDEYPPEMCQVGQVVIFVLVRQDIPTEQGSVSGYATVVGLGLDQIQIDKLLGRSTPPETVNELLQFHQQVAESTQGTGGFVQTYETPPVFTGLR